MKMKHFLILAVVFVALLALTAATTTEPNRGYSIIPTATDTHTLGTSTYKWLSAAITTLNATTVNATTVAATNISGAMTGTAAPSSLTVGTGGSAVDFLAAGQADINNGSTGTTVTLTGARPNDVVLVTLNEDIGAAADYYAYASTNTIHLVVNADPETTLTMNYAVISK